MMGELKKIGNAASRWVKKNPDTKNNYKDYEIFAEDLWNALKSRIPTLLEREPFFRDVFYPQKTSGWLSWWPFSVTANASKEKIFQQPDLHLKFIHIAAVDMCK